MILTLLCQNLPFRYKQVCQLNLRPIIYQYVCLVFFFFSFHKTTNIIPNVRVNVKMDDLLFLLHTLKKYPKDFVWGQNTNKNTNKIICRTRTDMR